MKSKIMQFCAVKVPGIPVILFFISCKNFGMPGYELSITIDRGARVHQPALFTPTEN
jgi:hypothetical protein